MVFSTSLLNVPGVPGIRKPIDVRNQALCSFQSDKRPSKAALFVYESEHNSDLDKAINYLILSGLKAFDRRGLKNIDDLPKVPCTPLIEPLKKFLEGLKQRFGSELQSGVYEFVQVVADLGEVILTALSDDTKTFDAWTYFEFAFCADYLMSTAIPADYKSGNYVKVANDAELHAVANDLAPLIIDPSVSNDAVKQFYEKFPRGRASFQGLSVKALYKVRSDQGTFYGACKLPRDDTVFPFKYGLVRALVHGEKLVRPINVKCIATRLNCTATDLEPIECIVRYMNSVAVRGEGTGKIEATLKEIAPLIKKKFSNAAPVDVSAMIQPARETAFGNFFKRVRAQYRVNPLQVVAKAACVFVDSAPPADASRRASTNPEPVSPVKTAPVEEAQPIDSNQEKETKTNAPSKNKKPRKNKKNKKKASSSSAPPAPPQPEVVPSAEPIPSQDATLYKEALALMTSTILSHIQAQPPQRFNDAPQGAARADRPQRGHGKGGGNNSKYNNRGSNNRAGRSREGYGRHPKPNRYAAAESRPSNALINRDKLAIENILKVGQ